MNRNSICVAEADISALKNLQMPDRQQTL